MRKTIYQNAKFLLSVANLPQLPPDEGYEVAIVGRSNSGKSSILNQLTQNKGLARVSKTPGRTQHINLFGLDDDRRIADLPGYGYAKVPPSVKAHWTKTLDAYLRSRVCLKGLILVMDIRHPLKDFDKQFLAWSAMCDLPVHVLLNKSDKLKTGAIKKAKMDVEKYAKEFCENPVSVQTFSCLKGLGIKEFQDVLKGWFDL